MVRGRTGHEDLRAVAERAGAAPEAHVLASGTFSSNAGLTPPQASAEAAASQHGLEPSRCAVGLPCPNVMPFCFPKLFGEQRGMSASPERFLFLLLKIYFCSSLKFCSYHL